MKIRWKTAVSVPVLSVTMMLSACAGQGQQGAGSANKSNTNMTNVAQHGNRSTTNLNDGSVIPSETSEKTRTTNAQGTTYSGMGQDIYGSIGSSGVHEGGISSYFESILKGEGINGVNVFVIDDTVVLARAKSEMTSHQYDHVQRDVLSGTRGMSGKGDPHGLRSGKTGGDNLDQARAKINEMFNGNVKILTATDPKTPDLVNRITSELKSSSYKSASHDVFTLLNMTK